MALRGPWSFRPTSSSSVWSRCGDAGWVVDSAVPDQPDAGWLNFLDNFCLGKCQ